MREILRFFVRAGHSITADCRNHKRNGCADQEAPEADIQTCGVDHGRDTEDAVTAPGVELDAQDTTDDTGNAGTHGEIDATIAASEHIGIAVDIGLESFVPF